jgi:phytoene dehydrogenase-like protein
MSDHTNGRSADCIVVGGGLAGLSCARELVRAGRQVLVVEAADRVGGRVATDTVDGFRIDRGFQVYNDAYPEGRRQLDLAALGLGRFEAGALVAEGGRLRCVTDPWRRPLAAITAVLDGTVGVVDGLRTARLRSDALRTLAAGRLDPDAAATVDDRSTRDELVARGFTPGFIRRFFVPFFGGVFLERGLDTSSDVFRFDFAMFARGSACLPHGGMDAIPRQLAAALPGDAVRLNTRVERVEPGRVVVAEGGSLTAAAVVVATEGTAAARLLPAEHRGHLAARGWKATRLVAFAAEQSPLPRPTLLVSADEQGPIDNLTVPSDVASGYAPAGRSLICVSVRGDAPDAAAPATDQPERPAMRQLVAAAAATALPTAQDIAVARPEFRRRFREPLSHAASAAGARHAAETLLAAPFGHAAPSGAAVTPPCRWP